MRMLLVKGSLAVIVHSSLPMLLFDEFEGFGEKRDPLRQLHRSIDRRTGGQTRFDPVTIFRQECKGNDSIECSGVHFRLQRKFLATVGQPFNALCMARTA